MAGEVGLETDADRGHARGPLPVGHAPVDLLPVEGVERVSVLAVVPENHVNIL